MVGGICGLEMWVGGNLGMGVGDTNGHVGHNVEVGVVGCCGCGL